MRAATTTWVGGFFDDPLRPHAWGEREKPRVGRRGTSHRQWQPPCRTSCLVVQTTTHRCAAICLQDSRPPNRKPAKRKPFVRQLDVIESGEYLLVKEEDGRLPQGSNKDIQLIRARDGHEFSMRCANFCLKGRRPSEKFVYQHPAIESRDYALMNKDDSRLPQGSDKNIKLIRACDGHEFSMRCADFSSRVCFCCLGFSDCTYAPNLCAMCWFIKNPISLFAIGHQKSIPKTEIWLASCSTLKWGK